MKTIQKHIVNKGLTYEKQVAFDKWKKFKALIMESDIEIKSVSENEILLYIENVKKSDIEIFPVHGVGSEFVHIQLWYYEFNLQEIENKHNYHNHRFSSIPEAIAYINSIYRDIKIDKKL